MNRRLTALVAALVLMLPLLAACGGGGGGGGGATNTPSGGTGGGATPTTGAAGGTTPAAGETPAAGATPAAGETPAAGTTETAGPGAGETPAAGETETAGPGGGETPAAAETGTAGPGAEGTSGPSSQTKDNPPAVANAAQAKQYSGQTITFYDDAVPPGSVLDPILAEKFSKETGIKVEIVKKPNDSSAAFAQYQRLFQAQSPDFDVMMIDVIFPAAFAGHLVDLNEKLGNEAKQVDPALSQNSTIDGHLVTMPWFADFGLLYYRKDLLQKYGFKAPPQTWDELQQQAQKIQDGERASKQQFQGFVFQGNAYEGLTCNALEWVASNGGGTFVDPQGKVTINNPKATDILNKASGWVGKISPQDVATYDEEGARNIFQGGNAAFMRNWPYAYSLAAANDSPLKGKFDVAPLPHGDGQKSVGTIGGWGLGVSKYSKSPDAAIEFVRYMTSPEAQTWRAVVGSYVPTSNEAIKSPEVLKAMPFLKLRSDIQLVARPSRGLGADYNRGSTAIFQGVNQVLRSQDAAQAVDRIQGQLERITR